MSSQTNKPEPGMIVRRPRVGDRLSIDVIIPAYNEEECVDELGRRLAAMFDAESAYDWRCIIVENGSSDGTWAKLKEISANDSRFAILQMSRTFYMDGGLTAGLDYATADAAVFMTADLQDPPEVIPDFVRAWERGVDNVYGLVTERQGTSFVRRFNSQAFYWLANRLSDGRLTKNASDFRLMDRRLYEAVRSMEERNRFMRGLVAWAGFSSMPIPVPRPPRFAGESKAHTWGVLGMAVKGIFAHTYKPLRLITGLGLFMSAASVVLFLGLVILWLTRGVPFPGFGSIVSLVLLLFGITTLMLGIISEYLSLIYEEVKKRPNFIVRDAIGLELRERDRAGS